MPTSYWILFNLFILVMLVLDLGVFHRKSHEVKFREAVTWTVFWILLALAFNAGVYFVRGPEAAAQFFAGYIVEKSLSVDNIFVFLMIFSYFHVPPKYQHKVLFWGILGALVMRAGFIFAGVALLRTFHWVIYLFGFFLVATGIKMVIYHDRKIDPEKNPVMRAFRRVVPVTVEYHGSRFFIRQEGRLTATPLFVALFFIEITDVVFAVDSIPAILAITQDTFIVYTSNVFAILGLRALYFALAGVMHMFCYLTYGLAAILVFVGAKMMLVDVFKVSTQVSLSVIASLLAISILASVIRSRGKPAPLPPGVDPTVVPPHERGEMD